MLGRITTSYTLCALSVVPLGAVLGGVVQCVIGMRATLFIAACVSFAAIGWVWRVRQPQQQTWAEMEHTDETLAA